MCVNCIYIYELIEITYREIRHVIYLIALILVALFEFEPTTFRL